MHCRIFFSDYANKALPENVGCPPDIVVAHTVPYLVRCTGGRGENAVWRERGEMQSQFASLCGYWRREGAKNKAKNPLDYP